MLWDAPTMIEKVLGIADRTWDSDGEQVPLTAQPGVIAGAPSCRAARPKASSTAHPTPASGSSA